MSIFGTGTQVGAEGPATGSLTALSGSRPAREKKRQFGWQEELLLCPVSPMCKRVLGCSGSNQFTPMSPTPPHAASAAPRQAKDG